MLEVDITRLVPKFILNDRNGYAVAKALEAGMAYMLKTLQAGVQTLTDVESMPEWRLDEMAWELGCPYDYNGTVENKRRWISNAVPYYSVLGTPKSIINYLEGYFDEVTVVPGAPYHFGVNVAGELDEEKEAWLRYAVERVKNVRSVFDGVGIAPMTPDILLTGIQTSAYTVASLLCGMFRTGLEEL